MAIAIPSIAVAQPADTSDRVPQRVLLTMNGDPATQMAVSWRTAEDAEGAAQFTEAKPGPRLEVDARTVTATVAQTVETTTGVTRYYKSATMAGLKPSTKYAYRVGDGQVWSEWNHFKTASDKAQPFSFIYVGDAQNDVLSLWSRVLRDAFRNGANARFILHAGDLINHANNDEQWGEWFEAAGWINRVVPVVAIPGNHEHHVPKGSEKRELSQLWQPQFEYPRNGVKGLEDTNYFLDYQGVRIVGLNSNMEHVSQAEWLDKVLADNPNRWTILTFHHPVFSAAAKRDNPDLREAWMPIIDKYDVDLVLQGHDHTYGRSEKISSGTVVGTTEGGSVYVVSVSGPKMYDLTEVNRDIMARVAEDTQLYQRISIDGDTLKYVARTAAGDRYDAFELKKGSDGENELLNKIPAKPENRRPARPKDDNK